MKFYTYALITARKNSKEIKDKNLKKIGNLSITRIVEKSYEKNSQIKKIFISSDSKKILNETSKKTTKILRPKNISKDSTKSEEVIFHFLDWIKKNDIVRPKYLYIVQPTSPFVSKKNITKALNLIKKKKCGSVTSIYPVPHKFNAINQRILLEDKKINFIYEKKKKKQHNRQLKTNVYAHGNIFLVDIDKFIKQKIILAKPNYAFVINSFKESIDIDTTSDLKLARIIATKKV